MKSVMAGLSIFRESLSVAHKIEKVDRKKLRGTVAFQSNDDFLPSIQTVRKWQRSFLSNFSPQFELWSSIAKHATPAEAM
jgi:predicted rRNA methylase YqxC with S4 and FtsJ domains